MLYATVRQRKIHVKNPVTVIQNGIGVDQVVLDMDDEWKDMSSIVCVFALKYKVVEEQQPSTQADAGGGEAGGETKPTLVTVTKEITREVLHTFGQPIQVPWECLAETGLLSVSCTGYVGSTKVMTTMLPDSFWNVVQNGPVTGDTPMEPTATLYEQVVAAAGAANTAATQATEIAERLEEDRENGVFNGEDGETPVVTIGTVVTGASGSEAQVTRTGSGADVVLNFVLPRGTQGTAGTPGKKGDKGDRGEPGEPGAKGEKGDPGAAGAPGAKGDKGDKGDKGEKGDKGDTGAGFRVLGYYTSEEALEAAVTSPDIGDAYGVGSAAPYDIYIYSPTGWVNNGQLQGAKGDPGPKGEKGDPGEPGAKGEKGDKGDTGAAGAPGAKGDKGDTGATGATGAKGEKGDKGDAGAGVQSLTYNSSTNKWTVTLTNGSTLTVDGPAIPDVSAYMPKSGGTFLGAVKAATAETGSYYVRNIKFSTSEETPTAEGDICFKLA